MRTLRTGPDKVLENRIKNGTTDDKFYIYIIISPGKVEKRSYATVEIKQDLDISLLNNGKNHRICFENAFIEFCFVLTTDRLKCQEFSKKRKKKE